MAKSKPKQFKDVPSRVNIDDLEQEIIAYWQQKNIYQKTLDQNKDNPLFSFYDGPPYATGKPHYGTILQSVIKDAVLRHKTMRGHYVPRRVGWDCHGLPVENLVEKEIGIKTKKEIEEYGIERFNQKCRDTVFRHIDDFTNTLQRMGRWADYDNAYATLNKDYMESEWWVFRQLWDQGLVYQAFRSTPYCTRCETPLSNFEVSINYRDTKDTAVFVRLKVDPNSIPKKLQYLHQESALLIWTTTPWTLPGNAAVAVSQDLTYVTVKDEEGRLLILAQERVREVLGDNTEIIHTWKPSDLTTLKYFPPYPEVTQELKKDSAVIFVVLKSDHVVGDEGTGIVHIAPAFGVEDSELGKANNLPTLRTVAMNGKFTEEVTKWAGKNIFEVNREIVEDLEDRGVLVKQEKYKHSYPFCWRCETPLIYYALDSWFIKISAIKDKMLSVAQQINWTPKHVKKGRFGKGLESAPDWAVSRNRFWSVPMPIWECEGCGNRTCVGSIQELKELSQIKEIKDIHRPYVDDISWPCDKCQGQQMKRIPEVLDVWFDAGSMPYAQSHYPFENKEEVQDNFPADFIIEMIEQTRLWFYVLHVLAVALTQKDIGLGKDSPAFKHAVASGLIFAEDGRKLSKKLKNYPEPEPTIKQYGADTLRLYLLSSATLGETYKFSERDLKKLQSNTYLTLWNVYSFFVRYANTHGISKGDLENAKNSKNILDKWIVARTKQLEYDVLASSERYRVDTAVRHFIPYVDDLSNWYVRRSRNRFQRQTEAGSKDAFATLYQVLTRTAKVMAPYIPFLAEEIYRNLTSNISIHLEQLAEPSKITKNEKETVFAMAAAREIVTQGLALRALNGLKVRQPLNTLFVKSEALSAELLDMIKDEVNVKEIIFTDNLPAENHALSGEESKVKTALDLTITDALRREGIARDIIRHGQTLRRDAGYELNDRIHLLFKTDSPDIQKAFDDFHDMICKQLQVNEVMLDGKTDKSLEISIEDQQVKIGVKK